MAAIMAASDDDADSDGLEKDEDGNDPADRADEELRFQATELLTKARHGDAASADQLLPLVYDEMHHLAERFLRREVANHTLQPTALVHEAYLRLVEQSRVDWQGRTHFFAVGARIMHRLLIDHGRNRKRAKRGGGWLRITLAPEVAPFANMEIDALAVHEAIEKLESLDPRQARLVELRFFSGLSMAEIAGVLGVSKRTAEADWTHARAWLARELS